MGGSDDKSNLVDLTPEEHFLAHQLLLKIHRHGEPQLEPSWRMLAMS